MTPAHPPIAAQHAPAAVAGPLPADVRAALTEAMYELDNMSTDYTGFDSTARRHGELAAKLRGVLSAHREPEEPIGGGQRMCSGLTPEDVEALTEMYEPEWSDETFRSVHNEPIEFASNESGITLNIRDGEGWAYTHLAPGVAKNLGEALIHASAVQLANGNTDDDREGPDGGGQ